MLMKNVSYFRQFSRSIVNSSVSSSNRQIGIIGVPLCDGQGKDGTELGPEAIRNAGLHKALRRISGNIQIKDYGNIEICPETAKIAPVDNMKNYSDVISWNKALFDKVGDALQENDQILNLGGDHAMAIGSVLGHLHYDPDMVLVWVDAHADINLNVTSNTGNMHGMPVSFLIEEMRNFSQKVPNLSWTDKRLPAHKMAYIGLRDIDPFEATLLQKFGIRAFGMGDVDKYGMTSTLEMITHILDPHGKAHFHISFDIDAIDPSEAPSTGTPVRGGLTLREGIQIMEYFARTNRVRCVDLVEVNPKIGNSEDVQWTTKAAIEIIKGAFGHNRTGNAKSLTELQSKLQ